MKAKKLKSAGVKSFVFVGLLLISLNKANAQFNIGGPGTNGSGIFANGTTNTPVVPFDGGMSIILIAGGIGYCSKKINNLRSK